MILDIDELQDRVIEAARGMLRGSSPEGAGRLDVALSSLRVALGEAGMDPDNPTHDDPVRERVLVAVEAWSQNKDQDQKGIRAAIESLGEAEAARARERKEKLAAVGRGLTRQEGG